MTAENATTVMNLAGTGKYVFLHVSPSILDFGDVVVGSAKEITFDICNTSEVLAKVYINVIDDFQQEFFPPVFKVELVESSIQPNNHLAIKVW
jgi:hypothetical protein